MIEATQRQRLRILDGCLQSLEDAHERDESLVPPHVMKSFWHHLPWLATTMSIRHAIDSVFAEQESILREAGAWNGDGRTSMRLGGGPASPARIREFATMEPLDEAGARKLTAQIRTATRQVCLLLLEAHERRVWVVLAYTRWEDYVSAEFGFSRSRSYELLDQARVILAVQEAASLPEVPDISGYAASQIKHHLPEITEEIRACARESGGAVPMRQVLDTVGAYRAQAKLAAPEGADASGEQAAGIADNDKDPCLYRVPLHEVTTWLANLPSVDVVMPRIRKLNRYDPAAVAKAARWLSDFAVELDDTLSQTPERHLRVVDRADRAALETPGPRSAQA
jgi:hypothetical protein